MSLPQAIRCPRPQDFENGEYWPRAPYYNLSDEISFHCYDGYTLRGSANRTCQVTGRWDGQTAVCDNGGEVAPPRGLPRPRHSPRDPVAPGRCRARGPRPSRCLCLCSRVLPQPRHPHRHKEGGRPVPPGRQCHLLLQPRAHPAWLPAANLPGRWLLEWNRAFLPR